MSSQKLRRYLAYYRKVLRDDPEHIEARLRLAALFREMGRPGHAVEEYGMAAKLLASEGLPLEAIAACKAILEIDPAHQETQFFLARLYARVPEATGDSVRVARPMGEIGPRPEGGEAPGRWESGRNELAVSLPTHDERGEETIVLDAPKRVRVHPYFNGGKAAPREEVTTLLSPQERADLLQAVEDDEDAFEVGLFDMESLALDEDSAGRWDDLSILDELSQELDLVSESSLDGDDERAVSVERRFRISSLPEIPLFSQLPRPVFLDFLNAMELRRLPRGFELLRADDPRACLYIIVNGEVRVEKTLLDGRVVELATMGEGQAFGEFRLLTGKGGAARVVAQNDVELLEVRDEVVYSIAREYPAVWDVLWGFYFERMLNHSLATSEIFGELNNEERALVGHHFIRRDLQAGELLFSTGAHVEALSLIVNGRVDVKVPGRQEAEVLETLGEGTFLGVSPCALRAPAKATVQAVTDLVVLEMPASIFRELIYGLPDVAEAVRRVIHGRQRKLMGLSAHSQSELL